MDPDRFWMLIDAACEGCRGSQETFLGRLTRELSKLSAQDLPAFRSRLDDLMDAAYSWDLWGAAYIMNGGCSDDMFDYWRAWLVAQGRDVYEAALADPDSLAKAKLTFGEQDEFECEALMYVAADVYEEKTGEQMKREPGAAESARGTEPGGERWDEDDLEERFPKLAAKFG